MLGGSNFGIRIRWGHCAPPCTAIEKAESRASAVEFYHDAVIPGLSRDPRHHPRRFRVGSRVKPGMTPGWWAKAASGLGAATHPPSSAPG